MKLHENGAYLINGKEIVVDSNDALVEIKSKFGKNTTKEEANYVSEYMFRFTAGANCAIILPSTVKYNNGQTPEFTAGNIYEYSITDNLCVVGEFY